jgi:hypothetical protein
MSDSAFTSTRRHIDVASNSHYTTHPSFIVVRPAITQLLGIKKFVAEFNTYSTYASVLAGGLAPMPSLGIVPR